MTLPWLSNIRSSHSTFRFLAISMILVLAACSGETTTAPSQPVVPQVVGGWLTLQLNTPSNNDGAVQFEITGPALDSVKVSGYDGLTSIDNGIANVIVTGAVGSGVVAQVHIVDLTYASQYQATVVAAAARNTYDLQDLTSYRAVLAR